MGVFDLVRNLQQLHASFFQQSAPQLSMLESCDYTPVGVDSLLNGSELESYIASGAEGCRVGKFSYPSKEFQFLTK